MTKEDAYNSMQEGCPISHVNFNDGEFLYMDDTYVIRDENGDEFETSWDGYNSPRWETGWYIYKNKDATLKKRVNIKGIRNIAQSVELISHIQGKECPGKNRCLQYVKIAGEGACLLCDCNEDKLLVDKIVYKNIEGNPIGTLDRIPDKISYGNKSTFISNDESTFDIPDLAYKKKSLLQRIKEIFKK